MHERKLSGNMLQRYLIHREKKKLILKNKYFKNPILCFPSFWDWRCTLR